METKGVDAVLVADPSDMRYLSGFTGGTGFLCVTAERRFILTDSRYTLQAEEEGKGFQVRTVSRERNYAALLAELAREDGVRRVGFEDETLLYGTVRKLQEAFAAVDRGPESWVPLGAALKELRFIKTEDELNCLAEAERIGDEAFSHILTCIRPGVTEADLAAELEYFMRTHGAEGKSFDTIVASGYHSAMPHAAVSAKKLELGDFITMDFGCKVNGYCSDMTRTVVLGRANAKQREIYGVVLQAQEEALAGLKAGMTGQEGDALARRVIEEAGYSAYFGHSLGHSVGLEIHERPSLSPNDNTVLRSGMVETVEPGIYIPDFGGVRIEDMVVVEEKGVRNLTHSPKELIEL